MGCLYCGKDIGPLRLLRDKEFCSASHRQRYHARLGKAIGRLSAPESVPTRVADFRIDLPVQEGNRSAISQTAHFGCLANTIVAEPGWPASVAPALSGSFGPASSLPDAMMPRHAEAALAAPVAARLLLPRLPLAATGVISEADETAAPRHCDSWMPAGRAESAERLLLPVLYGVRAFPLPFRDPRIEAVPLAGRQAADVPPRCDSWMPAGQAEAVERLLLPVLHGVRAFPLPSRDPRIEAVALAGRNVRHADDPAETPSPEPDVPPQCDSWMPAGRAESAERLLQPVLYGVRAFPLPFRDPRIEAVPLAGRHAADVTPRCHRWMRAGRAEAAERLLLPALHDVRDFPSSFRAPRIEAVPLVGCYVRQVDDLAETPSPEPAARHIALVMDSRPALRERPVLPLRFAIHAVEDVPSAAVRNEPEPVGDPAPAMAVPEAMPVESMPRVAGFAAREIPTVPALRLPVPAPLAHPVTLAAPVAAPSAVPVESMPMVAAAEPRPVAVRPKLRKPALAHFQMAEEPADALAAPVAAPGPAPVECLPSAPAFAARPSLLPMAVLAQPFTATLWAAFAPAAFRKTPPVSAQVPGQQRERAVLKPLSRIAVPPAGAQPERPKPEVPRPSMFALEFYCQPIASAPVKRLEYRGGTIELLHQRFQLKPALRRFADYGATPRKLLQFPRLFHPRKVARKRISLSTVGKIAATIMVGVALWTGSRLADNISDALRARVATSERTVTAAVEARRGEVGNGPMARIRRAIADRAATQVTETFGSGMEAWGAGTKSWLPGWQHSPDGYVRTGQMALFQPSLSYTDYRMEFYGQIEQKSMGWVVRAQDKQNYYAMKFKVIEPGLRPIIAMVHYQVTHGKRGHVEETPLSVMVHNNEPYHVTVDVRGNRFFAAIEGELVDSWADDAPAKGGVGFFSDAGERARLYWMKVARNQDWLGRFCAYLADSGGQQQTAELWGPGPARQSPEPEGPQGPDAALSFAGIYAGMAASPRGARTSKNRKEETWIS